MSNRVEIKVDGKDVEATKMLSCATSMLRIIKSVERQIATEQGVQSTIRWRVDMLSSVDYGLIAIRAETPSDDDTVTQLLTAEVIHRLKGETP